MKDEELMAAVCSGDESAYQEIVRQHIKSISHYAFRMLGNQKDCEDITQETFLRLYQTSRRYQPTASLRAYLLRITKNMCIDHFRKKRPELMDDLPDPATLQTPQDLLEGAIAVQSLEKAIDRLPVNQRTALLLRHTEQLSYNRIAEVMDVSVAAVESLLVRARRTLKQGLADLQE